MNQIIDHFFTLLVTLLPSVAACLLSIIGAKKVGETKHRNRLFGLLGVFGLLVVLGGYFLVRWNASKTGLREASSVVVERMRASHCHRCEALRYQIANDPFLQNSSGVEEVQVRESLLSHARSAEFLKESSQHARELRDNYFENDLNLKEFEENARISANTVIEVITNAAADLELDDHRRVDEIREVVMRAIHNEQRAFNE